MKVTSTQPRVKPWSQLIVVLLLLMLTACKSPPPSSTATTVPGANSPPSQTNRPRLEGEAIVELEVNGQFIQIAVNGVDAPITAGNFIDLVDQKVYDGTQFHRVVRQPEPFVVQGGDPRSKDPTIPNNQLGRGGYIDPQTQKERLYSSRDLAGRWRRQQPIVKPCPVVQSPKLKHTQGAVAMARAQLPDSASSHVLHCPPRFV